MRFFAPILHHIRTEWPATVFVTALVTVAHLGTGWLNAIDDYSLLTVSNMAANAHLDRKLFVKESDKPPILVVEIDKPTYQFRYRERAPIQRCELIRQLSAVYAAKPDMVVIDIDLSPMIPLAGESVTAERQCQDDLDQLFTSQEFVKTVLLDPGSGRLDDRAAPAAKGLESSYTAWMEWKEKLRAKGVHFGNADIPVSYGMTSMYSSSPETLAAAALQAAGYKVNAHRTAKDAKEHEENARIIDARAYLRRLTLVPTSHCWANAELSREDTRPTLLTLDYLKPDDPSSGWDDRQLTECLEHFLGQPRYVVSPRQKVVFFGIAEGFNDVFLTPLGHFYGVEVHAAAFASGDQPHWAHAAEVVADLFIAFFFGAGIAFFWKRYFQDASSASQAHTQLAGLWLVLMGLGFLFCIAGFVLLSSLLMRGAGIWLSPLPIAIGMFIESCVSGSVIEARQQLLEAHGIIAAPRREARIPPAFVALWTKVKFGAWVLCIGYALALVVARSFF